MKKYYLYFTLTALFVLYILVLAGQAIISRDPYIMVFGMYGLLYLGLIQLLTGLYLLAGYKHYPDWVGEQVRNYWLFTGTYVLIGFTQAYWLVIPDEFIWLWLAGLPLAIAFYQFRLVWRMAGLRRRVLEKRAFLKVCTN